MRANILKAGIYKFTCKQNGKSYIGQSVNIIKRYISHLNNHKNKKLKDYNTKFYRALRKYGFENFNFEILELVDISKLNEKEIYWIKTFDSFNNGYNSNSGGSLVTEKGSNHPNSKLKDEDVLEIKYLLLNSNLSQSEIAYKFNITQSSICNINMGNKWSHLGFFEYPIRIKEARHRGSKNHKSVLTEEQVLSARKRYEKESISTIYLDYKDICSYVTFERAMCGKTYSHIPVYKKREKKWI